MAFRQMKYKVSINFFFIIVILIWGCDNSSAQLGSKSSNKKSLIAQNTNSDKSDDNLILAPNFTLANLKGDLVSLDDLKGKVILLNFWGTWCGPCRVEIPDFIKLMNKHKDNGLEIVGITLTSGSPDRISSFASQWGINYTLLTDIEGDETQNVTTLYGKATGRQIRGIPTTFLIDRDGFIRQSYVGPRSEQVFYKDIQPHL